MCCLKVRKPGGSFFGKYSTVERAKEACELAGLDLVLREPVGGQPAPAPPAAPPLLVATARVAVLLRGRSSQWCRYLQWGLSCPNLSPALADMTWEALLAHVRAPGKAMTQTTIDHHYPSHAIEDIRRLTTAHKIS